MAAQESDREISAVRAFNRFYTRKLGVLDQHLSKSPFSLSEARVLYELAHRDGLAAKEIGIELGLDPGYLSRIVQNFDEKGLISRKPLPSDRRQVRLSLTAKGRQAFARLNQSSQSEVGAVLAEKQARGVGVGRALVDHCIRSAREKGYNKMTLWTQSILVAARGIYQSAGFRRVAEEKHHSFGVDLVGETWELEL